MNKKYFISFVGEAIFNPQYEGYTAGRLEVYERDAPYASYEYRVFTNNPAFHSWMESIDFKRVSKKQLKDIETKIYNEFNIFRQ